MGIKKGIYSLLGTPAAIGKESLNYYNSIETADGYDLIMKDGSIASVISFKGSVRMIGNEEMDRILDRMSIKLTPFLNKTGHAIQVYFSRNPDNSARLVHDIVKKQRNVAQALGLNLDCIFDEDESVLPRYLVREDIFFVLWTRPSLLSKEEAKMDREEGKLKGPIEVLWPKAIDTQNVFKRSEMLQSRHHAFIHSFLSDTASIDMRFELLDGHSALEAVHTSFDPDSADGAWRPVLPNDVSVRATPDRGNKITKWVNGSSLDSLSALLWPRIDQQLLTSNAEIITPTISQIGNNYFSTIDMTVPPQRISTFLELLNKLSNDTNPLPWRISFVIEGDGMSGMGIKGMLASILSITTPSGFNKNIRRSLDFLRANIEENVTIVRLRVALTTWAPVSSGKKLIERRALSLSKGFEGWGNCQSASISGDPVASTMGTIMGMSLANTAPAGCAPIHDVLYMLPWMRDASPFDHGSCMFRTSDRRPFPIELGSSKQDTFNELISAGPGKGKSFWLATTNLAFCLSSTATMAKGKPRLPLVRVIDIGPSQAGFASILQESLPSDRRHEVVFRRMQMTKEYAINPFDTPLGNRMPLALDHIFLKNFLSIVATPENGELPNSMVDLIGAVITELYRYYSDKENRNNNPKAYVTGDYEVDAGLKKYNIVPPKLWWECVDAFMNVGDVHLAHIAQRYAVPRLEDLISFSSPQIEQRYSKSFVGNTTQTIMEFLRVMAESVVAEYPVLAYPTSFDLGGARVAILDLQSVIGAGGEAGDKQTAMMYMLARYVLTNEFYHSEDILSQFNPDYYEYHEERISQIRATPKRIVFDEFHNTKRAKGVVDQIERDMREGRKWNVLIALASQSLCDFKDIFFELASGVWIMGIQSKNDIQKAEEQLHLSETAKAYLGYLNGPATDGSGSPFLAVMNLKDGTHEHYLINTLGPQKVWGFSTTSVDVSLREKLYVIFGPEKARRLLAQRYPSGSAKKDIEIRTVKRSANSKGMSEQEQSAGVIDEIVKEIVFLESVAQSNN